MKEIFIGVFVLLFFTSKSQSLDTVKVRIILSDTSTFRDTSRIYVIDTGYAILKKGWKPRKYVIEEGRYENDNYLIGYLDADKKPFSNEMMIICYYEIKN